MNLSSISLAGKYYDRRCQNKERTNALFYINWNAWEIN